jgi:membrane fusion protein, copper/silver efflux system
VKNCFNKVCVLKTDEELNMKIKHLIRIIVLGIVVFVGWNMLGPKYLKTTAEDPGHQDIYYCPMHPQIVRNQPGTCPICFMQLVKKETKAEDESKSSPHKHLAISIPPEKQKLIGIKTMVVAKNMLTKTIHTYGYVAHDLDLYEAQLEYIRAWQQFYAYQSRRPVKDEFKSDWRQYYQQATASGRWRSDDKLKAQEDLVKAEYELRHMGLTDTQLEQLRQIKYGQPWVQPDLLFFEEGRPSWVYASVPENELGYIAITQKAIVTIPAYGEKTEGVVVNIAEILDPETRTTRVRVELPQYRSELKVNMYVDVDFPVDFDSLLLIPRDAIIDSGKEKIVFVKTGEGIFERRAIVTGLEGDGMAAVKSGLKEGEEIVASGNFLLDSESKLKTALEDFGPKEEKAVPEHVGHGAH